MVHSKKMRVHKKTQMVKVNHKIYLLNRDRNFIEDLFNQIIQIGRAHV